MLVAEGEGGAAAGYATGGGSAVGLLAVAEEARGRGLGRALLSALVGSLRENGAGEIEVITQGRNEAASALYRAAGFLPRSEELWFHRWYSPSSSGASDDSPPTTRSSTT